MIRRAALTALPVLIGAAIEVSGLGGPTLSLVAWILVGLTVGVIAIHWLVDRHVQAAGDLGSQWHRLGKELLAFARKRRAEAAQALGGSSEHAIITFIERGRRAKQKREHDDETVDIYLDRFEEQVREAICELLHFGLVGETEAKSLHSPTTPKQIETLGRRLMELSYRAP